MSKKDFIVGLDIGTTKVCCIVGEFHHANGSQPSSIDIVGFGQAPSLGFEKAWSSILIQPLKQLKKR